MPRTVLRGVSRAAETRQPGALRPPKPPWHGKKWYFTCLGACQALTEAPNISPCNAGAAPALKDGAHGRGAKEGQGCLWGLGGKTLSTRRSATLLEAFPRVMVPRREEEVGCHNPQSACKPPRRARRQPRGSPLPGDGPQRFRRRARDPSLAFPPTPCPPRPPESGVPRWLPSGAVSKQERRRLLRPR